MKIGIIDADLIGRKNHRFPNLVSMKLSAYYKNLGGQVQLLTNYDDLVGYDKVFISKVFTDTYIAPEILEMPNVSYGGTGFYYDKAPRLSPEIEHHMPDYHLYDDYVNSKLAAGESKVGYKYYTDYSIGFLTRGCFRKCSFCVNQNYDRVHLHSPLHEFLDESRKKICMLDDNFLGHPEWKRLLQEVIDTGKPFTFKQGLDERILTDEKCKLLFSGKYDGDITFAFDNVADYDLIKSKLELIRKYTDKPMRFYVFTGFDRNNKWDLDFWKQDLEDLFKRIKLLMEYHCVPYIMRFNRYVESPYQGIYITVARWCNQQSLYKKKSLREYAAMENSIRKSGVCKNWMYLTQVERELPEIAEKYFDLKYENNAK